MSQTETSQASARYGKGPVVKSVTDIVPVSVQFDGVEVRALCRVVNFFYAKLEKTFVRGPGIVWGTLSVEKPKLLLRKL